MSRSAPIGRVASVLLALALLVGCDGRPIRLGNGRSVSDAGGTCPQDPISPNEVLWLGDSWILVPGNQHTRVRDLARAAGTIGPGDDYTIVAAAASTMVAIAGQYSKQEATATKAKVLILDGGTWDTIVANGSDASVTGAANAFNEFLATVANDGTVKHIIYVLPPELPGIPGVAALRPSVQLACAQSATPCHFLDLQPLWVGHPAYTASDGIFPTVTGAQVVAEAIWASMQENCIAQ